MASAYERARLEQIARNQWHFERVYLHVDPTNDGAVALYDRLGFRPLPEFDGQRTAASLEGALGVPEMRFMAKDL